MTDDGPELLHRERSLQAQAESVRAQLGLPGGLASFGRVVSVGGARLGLLTHRDMDFVVLCDVLTQQFVARVIGWLCEREGMSVISQRWLLDGAPGGARHASELRYRAASGAWTIGLGLWEAGCGRDPEAWMNAIASKLDPVTRLAILRIKTELRRSGRSVPSATIYEAVFTVGVRTAEEFSRYLLDRPSPA